MIMKVKFTQFFDLSSSTTNFTRFVVTAGGDYVKQRCAPQFACYKYYKLGRVSVKLVPASTLPVDPTGLSYETGETTIDPRDMFNPGLVRITNGEDVGMPQYFDQNTYYATLLDPRWFKFQLQQGFSRSAVPLAYNIGEVAQDQFPFGADALFAGLEGADVPTTGNKVAKDSKIEYAQTTDNDLIPDMLKRTAIQTGRIRLGWMPTDSANYTSYGSFTGGKGALMSGGSMAFVPEVDLITFILPKAYKTKFFYRAFVETTVYFKDPVAVNPIIDALRPYNAVDRFITSDFSRMGSSGSFPNVALSDYAPLHQKGGLQ